MSVGRHEQAVASRSHKKVRREVGAFAAYVGVIISVIIGLYFSGVLEVGVFTPYFILIFGGMAGLGLLVLVLSALVLSVSRKMLVTARLQNRITSSMDEESA